MQKYDNHNCLLQHTTLFAVITNKIASNNNINPILISYYLLVCKICKILKIRSLLITIRMLPPAIWQAIQNDYNTHILIYTIYIKLGFDDSFN